MQITASLVGSTATIATNRNGTSTTLNIKDAASLAADLAAFTDPDAQSVDRSSSTLTGTIPPTEGVQMPTAPELAQGSGPAPWPNGNARPSWDPRPTAPLSYYSPGFSQGGQRNQDVQVHPRGYILNPTDDGVQIITPAGTGQNEGKVSIPRDQIAAVISGLNA